MLSRIENIIKKTAIGAVISIVTYGLMYAGIYYGIEYKILDWNFHNGGLFLGLAMLYAIPPVVLGLFGFYQIGHLLTK